MNKALFLLVTLLLSACSADACDEKPSEFEKKIIARAEANPATAPEYFLQQIEVGASPEEQAVYLYGMGVAHQIQGNSNEARNDYLSASILGNLRAKCGLMELPQIEDAETTGATAEGERKKHDRSYNYKNRQ